MDKTERKQMLKKRIPITILTAIIIPVMLCVCIPLEIYLNNAQEFIFSIGDFLPINLIYCLVLFAIIFFSIFFLPERAYRIVSSIIIALGLLFFVQGVYLNKNMNSLAGDFLAEESISVWSKIGNIAIWLIVIAIAVVLSILKDKKGYISLVGVILSIVVIITQAISPLSLAISKPQGEKEFDLSALTNKNLTNIADSNNVFYFCIDKYDGRYADYVLANEPEIFSELQGFTMFTDHVSRYSHTYPAVANMLTRNEYDANKSREQFLTEVYATDDTISVLASKGYQINIYTQNYYCFNRAKDLPAFVENLTLQANYSVNNKFGLGLTTIQMALYRIAPLFLKNALGGINSSTSNNYVEITNEKSESSYSLNQIEVYDLIKEMGFKKVSGKQFTFIHVDGCHDIYAPQTCIPTMQNSFKVINEYIKAMKDFGVYENATIVITGDHSYADNIYQRRTALMVKPSGESSGALKTSSAQTSHDNIWATIMKSENIITETNYGESVFDIPEGDSRVRKYSWHTWGEKLREDNYNVKGPADDINNWELISVNNFDKTLMD